jgi:hypothetical protein
VVVADAAERIAHQPPNRTKTTCVIPCPTPNEPETANTFHRLITHLLSERVTHLIRAVDALLR